LAVHLQAPVFQQQLASALDAPASLPPEHVPASPVIAPVHDRPRREIKAPGRWWEVDNAHDYAFVS
jgi:hypothetical protein